MSPTLSLHRLQADRATDLLRTIMPIGGDDPPDEVIGWRDLAGRIRRVRADYPNGWRLHARFNAKGELISSRAQIKLSTKPVVK